MVTIGVGNLNTTATVATYKQCSRAKRISQKNLVVMLAAIALLVAFGIRQVVSVPSPSSVGSDLTFLFQNDLNWHTAPDHNGTILISKSGTNAQAVASCKEINESLLPIIGQFFHSDMAFLLDYISLETGAPQQQFWIASSPTSLSADCSAISLRGGIQKVPCNSHLQTFCSQSAPYRPNTMTDMSSKFQIQVKSKKLTVLGTRDHLSFRFTGIPYADPFDRFTYSKPFSGQGTIPALSFGSSCSQPGIGSEDCLFLNIFTPFLPQNGAASKNLRPVMFWIHGGGFTGGEGSDGVYDGGNLASRSDVVVVTINYRLGTLGFLALNDGVTNGNFGIADQITALQWVQDHISDFGGDPSRITIFGQSAGAGSVRALLAAKPAFGLFKGAIAQSNLGGFGYASTYSQYMTIQEQFTSFAEPLIVSVGCSNSTDVLTCLRGLPAQTLLSAPTAPRYIVVDGKFITTNELKVDGSGPAANAHVIFGWMRDDGADFIGSFPTVTTTAAQVLIGAGVSNDVTNMVLESELFPMPSGPNATLNLFNMTSRVGTDGEFLCIDQATLIAAAKHKVFPSIYAYQFDRSYGGFEPIPGMCDPPATAEFPNGDPRLPYFRCHSGELVYMFGTLGQGSIPFRDWNDLVLSQVGVDMWSSFARTFNPNPSPAFLTARGYSNTTQAIRKSGQWSVVTPINATPLRHIDIPLSDSAWLEQPQCDLLGYPSTLFG